MNPSRSDLGESTSRLADPIQRSDSGRVLLVASIVCCFITLVAIVLAAVALGGDRSPTTIVQSANGSPQSATQASVTGTGQPRIWSIAIGHDYGANEYIDKSGYLAGFHHDLIRAVCNAAGIICKTVWEPYTNCWRSEAGQHSRGGEGLLGRWYDGCIGWTITAGRTEVFSFTDPFGTRRYSTFIVKQDDTTFKPADLRNLGKPIGFLKGWASDEKCVARQSTIQGSVLPVDKIKYYLDTDGLSKAILNGTVSAGFATHTDMDGVMTGLKQVGGTNLFCRIAGNSIMTRKDSEFSKYWNAGFNKIKITEFKKLCNDATKTHGSKGSVNCID